MQANANLVTLHNDVVALQGCCQTGNERLNHLIVLGDETNDWLEEQAQRRGWPLKVQVYWLPKNVSWLDQVEIWFSIPQRKLLKPNDFESLRVLVRDIGSFVRYHNGTAKPMHWTYTIERLEQKLSAKLRNPVPSLG